MSSSCLSKDKLMQYLNAWLEVANSHVRSMSREFSDDAVAGLYIWCDILSRMLLEYITCRHETLKSSGSVKKNGGADG